MTYILVSITLNIMLALVFIIMFALLLLTLKMVLWTLAKWDWVDNPIKESTK